MTVVATTPYLDEAERFDGVGMLDQGRFLAVGSPRALTDGFRWTVVELVCGDARRAARILSTAAAVEGSVTAAQAFGDRVALLAEDGTAAKQHALAALGAEGLLVSSARIAPPSLENVFMQLLGGKQE